MELKIRSRDLDTLIALIKHNNLDVDIDVIRRAYDFAYAAHKNQKRLSGEPFIVHPLEVGILLADLLMDTSTIAAALLHDVVEDTGTTLEIIRREFGDETAELVDGVTKISSIKNRSRATAQAETLRKMLIATIRDIRVIIIKLADKLHNMRTIMFMKPEKQETIARETMELYAPMARRLGMSKISSELEDLAFHILHPDAYGDIKQRIAQRKHELEAYIENVRAVILEKLKTLGIDARISGRAKHYYSIYKKLHDQNKAFEDIYDIRAIRIITGEITDCYGVLGVVHTLWSPIASRFKDFIAVPKSNMYQSLHTTVVGPDGHRLEVQIRTEDMHATAEMGVAAHWIYKEGPLARKDYKNLSILKEAKEVQMDLQGTRDIIRSLKEDVYENEIFIFSPQGKIIKLPQGATPIDFAYAIHTEVGNHAVGAKVNGRMIPLKGKLKSGDIVEIMTSPKGHPSDSWLKFVRSTSARYKIRNWLRRLEVAEEHDERHRKEKEKEKETNREEKTATITIPHEEQQRLKRIAAQRRLGVTIEGTSNVLIRLSQCCQPIPGDDVVGFVTRGRGITVHKRSCPSLKRLAVEKERFIDIVWESSGETRYPVKMAVEATDRQNLLKDITDELSLCKTNIVKAEAHLENAERAVLKFVLEVKDNKHLQDIITRMKGIKNVVNVYKINEKVVLK